MMSSAVAKWQLRRAARRHALIRAAVVRKSSRGGLEYDFMQRATRRHGFVAHVVCSRTRRGVITSLRSCDRTRSGYDRSTAPTGNNRPRRRYPQWRGISCGYLTSRIRSVLSAPLQVGAEADEVIGLRPAQHRPRVHASERACEPSSSPVEESLPPSRPIRL